MSLLKQYRKLADEGDKFHGLTILQHAKQLGGIVKANGIDSMIDWGCGRGDAYFDPHNVWKTIGIRPSRIQLYDPSFKHRNKPPSRQADLVVCSDVLEHIPEPDVPAFVANLFAHAKKHVWASVCCRPADKCFPDGTNLHVTLRPLVWWYDTFTEHCGGEAFTLTETP